MHRQTKHEGTRLAAAMNFFGLVNAIRLWRLVVVRLIYA